jgi:hypothetical protein
MPLTVAKTIGMLGLARNLWGKAFIDLVSVLGLCRSTA